MGIKSVVKKRLSPVASLVTAELTQKVKPKAEEVLRKIRFHADNLEFVENGLAPIAHPTVNSEHHEKFLNKKTALSSWADQQIQWWYFTGHLKQKSNPTRRFAFELVFFERRTHLDYLAFIPAKWVQPRFFMAHFAITDIDNQDESKRFRFFHKGGFFQSQHSFASSQNFHFEIGGWSALEKADGNLLIAASEKGNCLRLELAPLKPLCYHGENGFSPRHEDEKVASYYCAYTRLKAEGKVVIDGEDFEVDGQAWMDHEKMLSSPEVLIYGWNWVSIQLDNDEELMLYMFKEASGNIDSKYSFGSYIDKEGRVTEIAGQNFSVETLDSWTSPTTKTTYPISQKITFMHKDWELVISPFVKESELNVVSTSFLNYWEGAVQAEFRKGKKVLKGLGFLELVGYDKRPTTKFLHFLVKPERC